MKYIIISSVQIRICISRLRSKTVKCCIRKFIQSSSDVQFGSRLNIMLLLVVRVVMPCRYQRYSASSVFMDGTERRHSPYDQYLNKEQRKPHFYKMPVIHKEGLRSTAKISGGDNIYFLNSNPITEIEF